MNSKINVDVKIIVFYLVLTAGFSSPSSSDVELINGGYEGVLVAISHKIKEKFAERIIENLKVCK